MNMLFWGESDLSREWIQALAETKVNRFTIIIVTYNWYMYIYRGYIIGGYHAVSYPNEWIKSERMDKKHTQIHPSL